MGVVAAIRLIEFDLGHRQNLLSKLVPNSISATFPRIWQACYLQNSLLPCLGHILLRCIVRYCISSTVLFVHVVVSMHCSVQSSPFDGDLVAQFVG